MATTFKNFLSNDIASTRTLLHEAIPITGSIVSGTYGTTATELGSEPHIKTYGHGMFESVYDYPYLSSSANHIFDMTVGVSSNSILSSSITSQQAKKCNIYNQMAQYLVGYDLTGSIKKFTQPSTGNELTDVFVVPFSRLLTKDEVKKGSFTFEYGVDGAYNEAGNMHHIRVKLTDISGSNGYYVDSPAGEYGELFAQTARDADGALDTAHVENETIGTATSYPPVGMIYYQAGIAVVSASAFMDATDGGILSDANTGTPIMYQHAGAYNGLKIITGSSIAGVSDAIRQRIYNISFNNTTELNSTIYFCRISHNDFNYSSNPTYLSASQLRVKSRASDTPVSYITTVGLYSADNELLAVAKLSEPLRKDPTNEITLRVRLDY